jgi:hypothetical protein
MDGRTFDRARSELVEAGLLQYEPGSRGAGHRSLYRLLLPALERDLIPAEERDLNPAENPAINPALDTEKTPLWSGDEVLKKEEVRTTAAAGAKALPRLVDVLEVWIRNGAYQYDRGGILDEIETRERKRHEKLDEPERDHLLQLASDLRSDGDIPF